MCWLTDNQLVEAGTVLVRLDDRDFRAQVDQATAQVDQAKANMANIDAQVAAQQARIDQAEKQTVQSQAALTFAQQQEHRYTTLVQKGAGSVEQAQQYASNLLQAQANYAAAQANAGATEKQLPVLTAQREVAQAQLEQARAALEQANANLSRTLITAPVAGRITRLAAPGVAIAEPLGGGRSQSLADRHGRPRPVRDLPSRGRGLSAQSTRRRIRQWMDASVVALEPG
jgi:membrane fusion protein (multidrug efflux system)